ncbi:hypothetical protein PG991_012386 [Apiospora marii]|uniref:Opioid growth factor receptor (OGFr) conserved domain-containing protein n=1 Tax=Apiospora marii TaxID=335849 RepID=A0ABR1R9J6_9PEZI
MRTRDSRMPMVTRPHGGVLLRAVRTRFKLSHHLHNSPAVSAFSTTTPTAKIHPWSVIMELQRRGWQQVPSSPLSAAADDAPAPLFDLLRRSPPSAKQADPIGHAPRASDGESGSAEFHRFLEVLSRYTRLLDSVIQPPELPGGLTKKFYHPNGKVLQGDIDRWWIYFFDRRVNKERPWLQIAKRRLIDYHRCLGIHQPNSTNDSIEKAKAVLAADDAGLRVFCWLMQSTVRRLFEEKLYEERYVDAIGLSQCPPLDNFFLPKPCANM